MFRKLFENLEKARIGGIVTALGAVLLGVFAGSYLLPPLLGQKASLTPYTAIVREQHFIGDDKEVFNSRSIRARRSDGSIANHETRDFSAGDKWDTISFVVIENTAADRMFSIYPRIKAVSTTKLPAQKVARMRSVPDRSCPELPWSNGITVRPEKPLGQETIAGYPVFSRTLDFSGASGKTSESREKTDWIAPGLDCLVLRSELIIRDAQAKVLTKTTVEVLSVFAGEPSPKYFEVPPGLEEVLPSEVIKRNAEMDGRRPGQGEQGAMEIGDRFYNANRP